MAVGVVYPDIPGEIRVILGLFIVGHILLVSGGCRGRRCVFYIGAVGDVILDVRYLPCRLRHIDSRASPQSDDDLRKRRRSATNNQQGFIPPLPLEQCPPLSIYHLGNAHLISIIIIIPCPYPTNGSSSNTNGHSHNAPPNPPRHSPSPFRLYHDLYLHPGPLATNIHFLHRALLCYHLELLRHPCCGHGRVVAVELRGFRAWYTGDRRGRWRRV